MANGSALTELDDSQLKFKSLQLNFKIRNSERIFLLYEQKQIVKQNSKQKKKDEKSDKSNRKRLSNKHAAVAQDYSFIRD